MHSLIQLAESDVEEANERLRVVREGLAAAHAQLRALAPRMAALQAALDSRETRISTLRQQVAAKEDEIFGDFSRCKLLRTSLSWNFTFKNHTVIVVPSVQIAWDAECA